MGVVRTTYMIDENEIIIRANDKVKAAEDPEKYCKNCQSKESNMGDVIRRIAKMQRKGR